jgi:hypothetical protein
MLLSAILLCMFDDKIKTQDLLNGLKHNKNVLFRLLNQGKEYNAFLTDVLGSDELFNLDKIVHVTDVAQRLNISSIKIRKYLEQIYDDIIAFLRTDDKVPLKPDTPICSISIRDRFDKYLYINKIQLSIIPREG